MAASAEPGQIRLSRELFQELDVEHRRDCHPIGSVELRGAARPFELLSLDWHEQSSFPSHVLVRETQQQIALPQRDIISFGRLEMVEGMTANDIVLALPDAERTRQISRWHFELRRRPRGYLLRSVTHQSTLVNGVALANGQEVMIEPDATVELAGVITLDFLFDGPDVPHTMDRTLITVRPRRDAPEALAQWKA
jgi:hypothetical protein